MASVRRPEETIVVAYESYGFLFRTMNRTMFSLGWLNFSFVYPNQRTIIMLLAMLLSQSVVWAQNKRGNIAIFGGKAVLDFNVMPVKSRVFSEMDDERFYTIEGSASICDVAGNLLFYTEGKSLWTRNHRHMRNGFNIMSLSEDDLLISNTTTQDLIVPLPGNQHIYFVITAKWEGGSLMYAVVDMRGDHGLGEVISKGHVLIEKATEKMAVVRARNGDGLWLLTHEYGTDRFKAFWIDAEGIDSEPVISAVGSVHEDTPRGSAQGFLTISPDSKKVAVAIFGEVGRLELFDFDNANGTVSNGMLLQEDNNLGSYGVAFSPDNSKLYHTRYHAFRLVQYDLLAGGEMEIRNSVVELGAARGALQLGPDGRIFVASVAFRTPYVGTIERPNEAGTNCGFIRESVGLSGKYPNFGLPQLIYDVIEPDILHEKTCLGDTTKFKLTNADNVATSRWNFGDPSSSFNISNSLAPRHVFSAPGDFVVSCEVTFENGVTQILQQEITIIPPPALSLPEDTLVCKGSSFRLYPRVDESARYFLWSDGGTSRILQSSKTGTYTVKVSNQYCSVIDSIQVIDALPPKKIVLEDTSICEGAALHIELPPDNATFQWSDGEIGSEKIIVAPGTYSVTASNSCGAQHATISVSHFPRLNSSLPTELFMCTGDSVMFDAYLDNASSYLWSDGSQSSRKKVKSPGSYRVNINSRCESISDTVNVYFPVDRNRFMPNVITPNGDSFNDTFVLDESFEAPEFAVYNRWGQQVINIRNYQNNWPSVAPEPGVYYYTATDQCSQKTFKGEIHVLGE